MSKLTFHNIIYEVCLHLMLWAPPLLSLYILGDLQTLDGHGYWYFFWLLWVVPGLIEIINRQEANHT